MTACPSIEQLAALASGEDLALLPHVEACPHCQPHLDDQVLVRALVQHAPQVVLTSTRREALAAEVMARAELSPVDAVHRDPEPMPPRRAWWRAPAVRWCGAAAVAAVAIVVLSRARGGDDERQAAGASPEPPETRSSELVSTPTQPTTPSEAAPVETLAPKEAPPAKAATLAGTADYAHETTRDRDRVRLAGGELTIDATRARPVDIITGDTQIAVRRAKVHVIARGGVIAQVSVFTGTAEVRIAGKAIRVEAGTVWERPDPRADALAAFRDGWAALRDGRNAEAVTAFDRALDPTVAEDALYWAAIASERLGDEPGAIRRYRELLARFPSTARGVDARSALGGLVGE